MLAMVAANPGETALQVAVLQEFMHHLGDDAAQHTVARLISLRISRLELVIVAVCALPQRRLLRVSGAIDLHWSARQHRGGVCHLTAQVEKAALPRKSARGASREESTMEDIMKLCDVVRETGFAIHRYHKHGHLEKVYENALAHRLRKLGLEVKQQYPLKVYDEDGTLIGRRNSFPLCVSCAFLRLVPLRLLRPVRGRRPASQRSWAG